ncbi:helix-turn-helix domain-containing protein [Bacillus thuringiensis]|uniref:helix-turn-helix domain-containing protein n=1 Tax=Bacillus thuringiensis TaxID=1428 RepID=UPI000BFCD545|nr:helix-turn-helix domain-containing protein [Bacillus thuringiensis]PGW49197.1 hypothetical protein COE03_11545 [Bacillus thuringiensis]
MLKRHYQILELISHEERWFSLQEIADAANCSMKTIQRDIKYLTDFLPIDWQIKISKYKGIELIIPNSSSIESFRAIYFKQSLLFHTLEHLFYNDTSTSKELLERLYITSDRLKLLFLEIKQYLKKYHLILNKRPLKIIGNEIDILLMYYELYLKTFSEPEWPFLDINEKIFDDFFEILADLFEIIFCPESKKKFSFFISIYLLRKSHGHTIAINLEKGRKIFNSKYYNELTSLTKKIFSEYCIIIDLEDILVILDTIYNTLYFHGKSNALPLDYLFEDTEQEMLINRQSIQLHYMLNTTFNIQLPISEEFIYIIKHIYKGSIYPNSLYAIEKYIPSNMAFIKMKHSDTFNQVYEVVIRWSKQYTRNYCISDREIAILTMYVESELMKLKEITKTIVLILSGVSGLEKYLKEFLNLYFGKKLKYVAVLYDNLNINELLRMKPSCIITNIPLDKTLHVIPIVFISGFPTQRKLDEIEKFI